MLTLNLDNLNPGTWFDLPIGGRICLRVCAGDDLRAIRRETVQRRAEFRGGQRYAWEQTDEDKLSELLWDFCIVDWRDIADQTGKPVPCTKETKNLLMGKSPEFARAVAECLQTLGEAEAARAEEAEKN